MKKREIKFRAWDIGRKRWLNPAEHVVGLDGRFMEIQPENYALMQYTGLKDKNGKEIYEGDVVRWQVSIDAEQGGVGEVRYVQDEMAFCLHNRGIESRELFSWWGMGDAAKVEVIGDIYSNPELLSPTTPREVGE